MMDLLRLIVKYQPCISAQTLTRHFHPYVFLMFQVRIQLDWLTLPQQP
jgi:hypothetical protein